MQIIPLNRKVLLKPMESGANETKTAGGLFLAEKDRFEASQGEIVALGNKVELKLKKGDKVIYEDIGSDKVNGMVLIEESKIIAQVR